MSHPQPGTLGRRTLLGCAALCGAGPLLSACSSSDGTSAGADPEPESPSTSPSTSPGVALVAAAEVPVGGGVALTELQVVVTQPKKDQFKAWSGVCTHQGGAVSSVQDGEMVCALHGSRFDAANGEVVQGPATNPLPEITVEVLDGQVVRA
jgi:Rieske Fe-S protein